MELKQMERRVEVPRDGNGAPWVVPPEGGLPIRLTRTTTFVDGLEDKTNIVNWKTRSVAWAASQPEGQAIAAKIGALNPTGTKEEKQQANALVEALLDATGVNDKRDRGTYLHALTEIVDAGLPLPDTVTGEDRERMDAYRTGTALFDIVHVERFCVVPHLKVGGTPDRVSHYSGPGPIEGTWYDSEVDGMLITDVKTGNIEFGALKMAGQLGIYSLAKFYDPSKYPVGPALHARTGKPLVDPDGKKALAKWKKTEHPAVEGAYEEMGEINQEWGVIIHLPSTGEVHCSLHWINLEFGGEVSETAVTLRNLRKRATAQDIIFPVFGNERLPFAQPVDGDD